MIPREKGATRWRRSRCRIGKEVVLNAPLFYRLMSSTLIRMGETLEWTFDEDTKTFVTCWTSLFHHWRNFSLKESSGAGNEEAVMHEGFFAPVGTGRAGRI